MYFGRKYTTSATSKECFSDTTEITYDYLSSKPIRKNDGDNTWVFIVVGGVGVIIVGVVAVLFIFKVRPECMCKYLRTFPTV